MGEIVTKEDFWQIILNDTSQFSQITTEDEEFNEMSSFVWTVVQNTLVNTEDDNYIKSYEDMIGISGEGLTQYQRKVNILYMLSTKNYLALNLIKRGLINMGLTEFVVEHVKDENKVVVHTDRVEDDAILVKADKLLEDVLPQNVEVMRYNHHIEISWRDINKYAACKNYSDMQAVNPNFRTDLTSDGEWVYPLTSLTSSTNVLSSNNSLKKANLYMPSISGWAAGSALSSCNNLTEAYVYAPNIAGIEGTFYNCPKLKKVSGELKSVIVGHSAFLNSPIEILEIEFSKLDRAEKFAMSTKGNTSASAPRLNKESALRVLNGIPSFTSGSHPIALGIHVDHQNDEEVLEAIANAEAKGWTLTVQWNGTPTTQASVTYGLRKPPIYARVDELEHFDGTIERVLNWGHYVTNPEDYQEFSSLEEAYEHFGLEKPTFED